MSQLPAIFRLPLPIQRLDPTFVSLRTISAHIHVEHRRPKGHGLYVSRSLVDSEGCHGEFLESQTIWSKRQGN